jgi:hypothetical protein
MMKARTCVLISEQPTKDWHTRSVTLSETKGLAVRFFAEFILSEAEGLRMTRLNGHVVKCTNLVCFDLDNLPTAFNSQLLTSLLTQRC